MATTVYYLCNKQRKCGKINGCGDCRHTSFAEFAANGYCLDPENHPERFDKAVFLGDTIYVEKEDYHA